MFGWEGEKGNVWWDPDVFSLCELKTFLPKMGRKLGTWVDQNAHVHSAHHIYAFFFFFLSTCTYTIIFAKKICYFFVCTYTIFLLKKMCCFFCFIYQGHKYKFISISLFHPFIFLLNQTNKFSISPLFHPSNQTKIRENQISSILPLFYPLHIFYPPTFPLLQTNKPLRFG